MRKTINVIGRAYRGASYPAFDEMRINESCFDDELRAKSGMLALRMELDMSSGLVWKEKIRLITGRLKSSVRSKRMA